VIAARDGSVRLHSRDGERVATVSHSEAHSARFLPDGQRVLVVFGDLTVRLYDLQLRELLVLSGHSGHVVMAEVSPDGTQAATVGFDGTVRLWDLFDPELPVLTGHLDKIVGLAERPDGRLVSVGGDGTLRCWDPRTGRETQRPIPLIDRPWAMTLHDDGRHVLCAHWESTAASYDLDAPALSPVRFPQPGGLGMAAEWASDGSVWTAGRSLRTFAHASDGSRRTQLPWQGGQIVAMARSAQGRMAAAGVGGAIILLRASGEVERRWFGHDSWVHTLAWSPDGQWLASGADDRAVRLWQRETGERRELVGHTGRVMAVAWSFDGALLASASSDGSVRIWNADTAECVATLRLPGGAGVDAVLWSRDGRFLWAAGDDGMIRAWPATVPRLRELALSRVARLEAVGR
ncbi:MAG TPA: hypothetical protein VFZ65_13735, partial [Planctomycetota bacterium]|nr:hypothetical protein [Planctomycetota bacterium]